LLSSERIIEENRCLKLQLSKSQASASAAAAAAHDNWRAAPVASILQAPPPPPIEGKLDKSKGEKRSGGAGSVKLPMFDILNTPIKVQEPLRSQQQQQQQHRCNLHHPHPFPYLTSLFHRHLALPVSHSARAMTTPSKITINSNSKHWKKV
jgi:hypothetical protein